MPSSDYPFLPIPESLGCLETFPRASFGWHVHPFDELCMVADTDTTIGHAGEQAPVAVGTLYFFKRGERHGYWNTAKQSPRLWVIHYYPNDALYAAAKGLLNVDPAKRIWHLSEEQIETFKSMHTKIAVERTTSRAASDAAESAWLQLLLITIRRWSANTDAVTISPKPMDSDLQQLWQIIHDYQGDPDGLNERIVSQIPNYDSLRHRFRKTIGDSPKRLWAKLRLQRARNLLLESDLSIKEIASRTGFARQHEFARAFRNAFGMPPSDWRDGAFQTGDKPFQSR